MVPRGARTPPGEGPGLSGLRRPGSVTELLFLYECATREISRLRSIAERMELTVQAASHLYRQLARRGLVELRSGRYRPTVRGVDWLHARLRTIGEETADHLERLHVIRTTRAIAREPVEAGESVMLELVDGVLSARPGTSGLSRGVASGSAPRGAIVDVHSLQGIVPIPRAEVRVLVVPSDGVNDPRLRVRLKGRIGGEPHGVLAAHGLEAVHLVRLVAREPVARFGASAACAEASLLGVRSLAVVTESELPRFLGAFGGPYPPPVSVDRLSLPPPAVAARADRRSKP